MLTNPAIFAVIALVRFAVGYAELAMVQVSITMAASSIGVWLFSVQHQFEATSWGEAEDWDFRRAVVDATDAALQVGFAPLGSGGLLFRIHSPSFQTR